MNDQQLWDQLKEGEHSALKNIYDLHIEVLLQYGCRLCPNRESVEDCIHDLFIYIWNHRQNLSSTDSIRRYLMVALRRRIFKQPKLEYQDLQEDHHSYNGEISIEEHWIALEENTENHLALKNAFSQLTERQKEALYLKYDQLMAYEKICELMNLNYQSARNLISSAIQTLRKGMTLLLSYIFMILS